MKNPSETYKASQAIRRLCAKLERHHRQPTRKALARAWNLRRSVGVGYAQSSKYYYEGRVKYDESTGEYLLVAITFRAVSTRFEP